MRSLRVIEDDSSYVGLGCLIEHSLNAVGFTLARGSRNEKMPVCQLGIAKFPEHIIAFSVLTDGNPDGL